MKRSEYFFQSFKSSITVSSLFSRSVPPMVTWAQRPNLLFITVCLSDCKDPTIKVEPTKLYFKGVGGTEKKEYEVTLEFFKEIDEEVG